LRLGLKCRERDRANEDNQMSEILIEEK
jgi:hypothetical protein